MATLYRLPGEHVYDNMLLLPEMRVDAVKKITDHGFVDGDILVASYPKTGTTWTEEITWLIVNDMDLARAKSVKISDRMLFLEFTQPEHCGKSGVDIIADQEHPLIMKTHLNGNMFKGVLENGKLKVIVPIRNPKDTLVSYYHFYRLYKALGNFPGSWDDFFELYRAKHLCYGDYFDWYDSWLAHVQNPNVLFVKYEDMKSDIRSMVKKFQGFLGKELTEEQMNVLLDHVSFDQMKDNDMVNYALDLLSDLSISPFMRKGKVGDWKNYFSAEQSLLVDEEYRRRVESKGVVLMFE